MKEILYSKKVTLKGLTPLLLHKCGVIEKKATSAETSYDDEWKSTIYRSINGDFLIVPVMNLEAMMRDAAKGHKIAKKTMAKIICSGTEIVEFEVPIISDKKQITINNIENNKDKYLFSCAAVIQKNRIMRTRVMVPPGWEIEFTVNVFSRLIKEEILRDLLDRAGIEQGLMDWRPGSSKPGKFGQFEVISFN